MLMFKQLILLSVLLFQGFISESQLSESNLYQKAYSEYLQNQYNTTKDLLNKESLQSAEDDKLYMLSGDVFYILKDFDKAKERYSKAYKLKNKTATLKIAECYAQLNEPYKAVEYLKIYLKMPNKLLQSEIKTIPAFLKIEESKAWINLWKENYFNTYERKLDEAKFQISNKNYAEAFDILDKLLIKNKKRHRAYDMRGDLLILTKDYKNAARSYLKASEIKKHNLSYKTKTANTLFLLKRYKKAELFYNEIIADKYYNPEILLNITKNKIQLKKYSEASAVISQYLMYFPNNAEGYYLSGKIHSLNNENIAALEDFNRSIKKDNSKPEYFSSCGDAFLKTGTFKSAVDSYSMALDLNPKLPEIYYKKGIAELKLYKYTEACEDLKKAKSMNYNKADDLLIKYCK